MSLPTRGKRFGVTRHITKRNLKILDHRDVFSVEPIWPPAIQSFAKKLFDQQVWCWGRDVICRDGNLLLKYGFQRETPPPTYPEVPSIYRYFPNPGSQIVLRGFGLLYSETSLGCLYLGRDKFLPQFFKMIPTKVWIQEEIMAGKNSHFAINHKSARQLISAALSWIIRYEYWIQQERGKRWRNRTASSWLRPCCVGSQMLIEWKNLLSRCD